MRTINQVSIKGIVCLLMQGRARLGGKITLDILLFCLDKFCVGGVSNDT
jgi:hypothetical protein